MNNYLADTTVIIDHLRGDKMATVFLEKSNPFVSVVTMAELIQGSKDKREQAISIKIYSSFQELTINREISNLAIKLMEKFFLSHGLKFLDALIAATALENKLLLVTGNLKHFIFIKGLNVVSQKEVLTKS